MSKLEKNHVQEKDVNKLKDVSGGIGDVNVDVTSTVETHSENNSKTLNAGNIGGNVSF